MKPVLLLLRLQGPWMLAVACLAVFLTACTDHPPVTVSCKLSDGTNRPYPCEFRIEKLVFLGKDGSTLGEVTSASPTIALDVTKAKSIIAGPGGNSVATYDVKAVVRRLNAPSFPVVKGYILSYGFSMGTLQSDPRTVVTDTQTFPMAVGATHEALFELGFRYSTGGGKPAFESGPRTFFIENDVTTTKFPVLFSITAADKAEASLNITPTMK